MFRLKKLFSILLVTLMILPLASCAGIGDGALIGSPILSDDGSHIVVSLNYFDESGNEESSLMIRNEKEADALYKVFSEGKYVSGLPRVAIEMPYIAVGFHKSPIVRGESPILGKYRVYSDSCVFEDTSSGLVEKGRLDGIYEKLMNNYAVTDITLEAHDYTTFCEIRSYGLRNDVNRTFEQTDAAELWQIACYRGRADFSAESDAKKGEGAYYVINYYSGDEVDSTICIYENDVVVIVKRGVHISVLSTKVDGYREGIFTEIEKYLEGK